MATLYNLADDFVILLNLAQNGDITEEDYKEAVEELKLTENFESKIDDYIYIIDELKAQAVRTQKEINRLQSRKKSVENNIKRLNETLIDVMNLTNQTKIKTDRYTTWIQANPVSLIVNDESQIPKEFFEEQAPKLNKKELTKHFRETGEVFEGVEVKQSEGVRYR